MKNFDHVNANTAQEAAKLLKKGKSRAKLIAGGTDLLGVLKDDVLPDYPELIIDLKTIRNLDQIEETTQGLKIGALTTLSDIAESPVVRNKYKGLAEAAAAVATPQIRNLGTIGGNLCQEVRCWYYRYPHSIGGRVLCARKRAGQYQSQDGDTVVEGRGCSALTGENRYHSVFGAAKVGETPCSDHCAAGIDIPAYMHKIRKNSLKEAAEKLLAANPLPGITGRVCPCFCQEGCNRGDYDVAVSIREVERFLGDYILDNADAFFAPPEKGQGKRVAVVGSGPAGLSAAFYLTKSGHRVTVYDRMDEPGGMMVHAIPAFRLPVDYVRRLINIYTNMGITFVLNVQVGRDIALKDLRQEYESIVLATGAWAAPSIDLEGEDLCTAGLTFLADVKDGMRETPGKRVLVIGGGNVAIDVGITAHRLGAEEVTLVCLESREEMPALERDIRRALEEGVNLVPSRSPARILRSKGGSLCVDLVRCVSVFDDQGNFAPLCDDIVTETWEADRVILAVGQRPDLSYIPGRSRIKVDRDLILVDEETQETGLKGVFAGGDVTTGPATVVEAIGAGRRAAAAIDRFLTGDKRGEGSDIEGPIEPLLTFNGECLERRSPAPMPERPIQERGIDVEDALGSDLDGIRTEAGRCFNCGCVAVNASDMAPVLIALDATIKTTKRTLTAEKFFSMGSMRPSVIDPEEVLTEILIPNRTNHRKVSYEKFRIRKTVDFPIVSLASAFEMESGRFKDVRLVLGAVAPVPLRLKETEDFLKGREAEEGVAEQAAAMAVENALPLAGNAYKVHITKTLVRRTILAARRE